MSSQQVIAAHRSSEPLLSKEKSFSYAFVQSLDDSVRTCQNLHLCLKWILFIRHEGWILCKIQDYSLMYFGILFALHASLNISIYGILLCDILFWSFSEQFEYFVQWILSRWIPVIEIGNILLIHMKWIFKTIFVFFLFFVFFRKGHRVQEFRRRGPDYLY